MVTGQVIDVASEVFEVDAAEGDDDMLIRYSGIVGSISSLIGTPIALVASTAFLVITPSLVKRKPKP